MKSVFAVLLLVLGVAVAGTRAADAPKYPPFAIANSELRVLPPSPNGRTYQLAVHLPGSYATDPKRKYPVLYVTDAQWDFPTVVVSYDNLAYDKVVPEFIVVGLGYAGENLDYNKLRTWELTPVPNEAGAKASGHAAEFLGYLEKDIIPFVEREYRADSSYRVLAGSSLGGLFALYTMYTKPTLFQGCIAASPAVVVGKDWLLGYEEKFAQSGQPLNARLYVTGAENEGRGFLAGIKRYQDRLTTRKYPGFAYESRIIDGERHAGTKAESYCRGLRFVFEPLAPEKGPSK
ncbi:MAG TPA: alpha/beta hydrolase-fold protein [Candidatus Didemnitutus sp.]|nr:alpha/beta hydrolase-fold protein [Candidatus Didemnitutus sp.]